MTLKGEFSKLELMQGRVDFIPMGWEFTHLNKAFNIKNNFRKPITAVRFKNQHAEKGLNSQGIC